MARKDVDDGEWLENKILVLAYLFDKYLNAKLPNNAVADYSNYKYYERVRNRLKEEGKIEVKVSGRGAELLGLTKEGRTYVEKLLFNGLEKPNGSQFSSKENPEVVFMKKLKLVQLLPTRIKSEDVEKLFKALTMLYPDGFFKKGPVPEFLNQMADDIGVGPRVIVKKMVDSLELLYDTDIDMDRRVDLVAEVIDGCEMLEKVARLSRLWRFYRFNTLALHTVVRYAALFELGSMGRKLSYIAAAVYGALAITVLTSLRLITPETVSLTSFIIFAVGIVHLLLGVAAAIPFKYKNPKK
jgi:hypothetical protein